MPHLITIGKAAEESGLSSDTIRYYERLQLLRRPQRSAGGYRLYDDGALDRLRLIQRARSIGFSLTEIRLLFGRSPRSDCTSVRSVLGTKIRELDERIAVMRSFRDALSEYRSRCDEALAHHAQRCPLFDDGASPATGHDGGP